MKLKIKPHSGAAILVAFAFGSAAQAAFITGVISFDGQATLDAPLATAKQVVAWTDVEAGIPITGDFATYVNPDDPAIFTNGWSFLSGAVTPLWTINGFRFDLTSSSLNYQSSVGVIASGTGMVSYDDKGDNKGLDATPGTWFFSAQPGENSNFRFSASTKAPDGGTTLVLFGLSILGLHGIRRKLATH